MNREDSNFSLYCTTHWVSLHFFVKIKPPCMFIVSQIIKVAVVCLPVCFFKMRCLSIVNVGYSSNDCMSLFILEYGCFINLGTKRNCLIHKKNLISLPFDRRIYIFCFVEVSRVWVNSQSSRVTQHI